jgi:hypothetical protein
MAHVSGIAGLPAGETPLGFPQTDMRPLPRHSRWVAGFAAAVLALVALYAGLDPRRAWRGISGPGPRGDSRPGAGMSGAGVPAPVSPPTPVLSGSLAREMPRPDGAES